MASRTTFHPVVNLSLSLTIAVATFLMTLHGLANDPGTVLQDQIQAVRTEPSKPNAESDGRKLATADRKPLTAIDLSGFGSGISHWRNLRDDRRFITVTVSRSILWKKSRENGAAARSGTATGRTMKC